MFLIILEYVLVVIAILLLVTQVVIPIFVRRPLFPLFRRQTLLLEELQDLEVQAEVDRLQNVVDSKRDELKTNRDKHHN